VVTVRIFVCIALLVACTAAAGPALAEPSGSAPQSAAVLVDAGGAPLATRPLPQHHGNGTAVRWTCRYYGVTAVAGDVLPAASTQPAAELAPGTLAWLECFDDDDFALADEEFLAYDPANPLGPVGSS
jgi:hypothetical protein